jgi:hypothetical protein
LRAREDGVDTHPPRGAGSPRPGRLAHSARRPDRRQQPDGPRHRRHARTHVHQRPDGALQPRSRPQQARG